MRKSRRVQFSSICCFLFSLLAYKDKRADSLIPEQFLSQRPKLRSENQEETGPLTPPSSPPHDNYAASEGEGEAVFASAGLPVSRRSPRRSPSRGDEENMEDENPAKRQKHDPAESVLSDKKITPRPPPPPPAKSKAAANLATKNTSAAAAPPPARRQSAAPPPPPPKQEQQRKMSLPQNQTRPPPPSTGTPNDPTLLKPNPPASQAFSNSDSSKPPPPQRNSSAPANALLPAAPSSEIRRSISQGSQGGPPVDGIDMQSPDKKPGVNLPPGWMCVWSKSQKRWYFCKFSSCIDGSPLTADQLTTLLSLSFAKSIQRPTRVYGNGRLLDAFSMNGTD